MRRIFALATLALLILVVPVAAKAQAVIVPSPVPSCADGDVLQWSTASSNFVCAAATAVTLPLADDVAFLKDNSDGTKRLRFEVSAVTTGTTRVWTIPDANISFPSTVASLAANTFTGTQTLNNGLTVAGGNFAISNGQMTQFASSDSAILTTWTNNSTGTGASFRHRIGNNTTSDKLDITVYGGNHSTLPNAVRIGVNGGTSEFQFANEGGGFSWRVTGAATERMLLTNAGILTVSGHGSHKFASVGNSINELLVKNTDGGAAAAVEVRLSNDVTSSLRLRWFGSGYTPAVGPNIAGAGSLEHDGSAGFSLAATAAGGDIRFYSGGTTLRATLSSAGILTVTKNSTHTFGSGGTTASEPVLLKLNGANATSGGGAVHFQKNGAVDAYVGHSSIIFDGGTNSAMVLYGGHADGVKIVSANASGAINFYSGSATLKGTFVSSTTEALELFTVNPLRMQSINSSTGTTAIIDASGYLYKLSSSRRYKTAAPLVVSPDALAAFLALSPEGWDYTGQQTGAFGFISEELAELPLVNAYGRSPLVNHDTEGRPESNRDFALIGLQHLVLQDHERLIQSLIEEVAALKQQLKENRQ